MLRKNAFTLIELLVVISIIAVLMAIMMPALAKARAQAKTTICASNQKQVGLALNLYANAHKQKVIIPCDWDIYNAKNADYSWAGRLFHDFKYIDSSEFFYCPESVPPVGCTTKWDASLSKSQIWSIMSKDPMKWSPFFTYGLRPKDFDGTTSAGLLTTEPIRLDRIKRPSEYLLLTDTSWPTYIKQGRRCQFYMFDAWHVFYMLHTKGANVLMSDGSVARFTEEELRRKINGRADDLGPFIELPFLFPDGKQR